MITALPSVVQSSSSTPQNRYRVLGRRKELRLKQDADTTLCSLLPSELSASFADDPGVRTEWRTDLSTGSPNLPSRAPEHVRAPK